ncbi:MAG: hypothetical protein JKX87_00345 [Cycloclasticus sp.]|nr:hypothetical protein [Cycloclasticus sp.]
MTPFAFSAGRKFVLSKCLLRLTPYVDLIPHRTDARPRKPGRFKKSIKLSKEFDSTPLDIIDAFDGNS